MKKSELIEGRDYAAGSTSRYDRYALARITVLHINGERPRDNGTMAKGIVVRLVSKASGNYVFSRHVIGEEFVLPSARHVQKTWDEYEKEKAAHNEAMRARAAEEKRCRDVAMAAAVKLRAFGVPVGKRFSHDPVRFDAGVFTVKADAMAGLLERLDPVEAAEDALRAFLAKGQDWPPDDGEEGIIAAVLDELRERLATSPDGYKLASCGAPQDGDPF